MNTFKVGDQITAKVDGVVVACTVQEVSDGLLSVTLNAPAYQFLLSADECKLAEQVSP